MSDGHPPDRYRGEEVFSTVRYPPEYVVLPISEQVARLRSLFPGLGGADEALVERELPSGAEGYFAIPRVERIAGSYGDAVLSLFEALIRDRPFWNRRPHQMGPAHLRPAERTSEHIAMLSTTQSADILIVPAQFGLRHRGRSPRRAEKVFTEGEFGLGAFHVAAMLLTHPGRLAHERDLRIDCAGDLHFIDEAPILSYASGRLEFGASYRGDANAFYGSATGFTSE